MGKSTCFLNLHLLQQESVTVLDLQKQLVNFKFIGNSSHFIQKLGKKDFTVMHLFKCLKCVLHSDVKNVVESYLTIKKSLTKQWICGMNVLLKGLKDIY